MKFEMPVTFHFVNTRERLRCASACALCNVCLVPGSVPVGYKVLLVLVAPLDAPGVHLGGGGAKHEPLPLPQEAGKGGGQSSF